MKILSDEQFIDLIQQIRDVQHFTWRQHFKDGEDQSYKDILLHRLDVMVEILGGKSNG